MSTVTHLILHAITAGLSTIIGAYLHKLAVKEELKLIADLKAKMLDGKTDIKAFVLTNLNKL